MQAIPAIIENRIVPAIGSFKKAPMKKPTIPAMTIIMTDATVLNFFITINEQIQNIAQKKDTLCRRMYN